MTGLLVGSWQRHCHLCLKRSFLSGPSVRRQGQVDQDEIVFFANWQCAAGGALHRHSTDAEERAWVAGYLAELQVARGTLLLALGWVCRRNGR